MYNKLIIIGAGGDGRNVAEILCETQPEWNLLGFLDDDPEKQNTKINGVPVIGTTSNVTKYKDCHFLVLVGNPQTLFIKKRLVNKLGINSEQLVTVIHPSAVVSRYTSIGKGSVILPGVTIMANAVIGEHVYLASKVNIGHDTKIEDYVFVAPLAGIPGNVVIQEGAYIGLNVSIRGGVTIGKWSIVGMGSVVISDVPPYHVVAGNPARVLKKLNPAELEL